MAARDSLLGRIAAALKDTVPQFPESTLGTQDGPGDLPANLRNLSGEPLRRAAVLVPLIDNVGSPGLLLTRRNDSLRQHAGQISFPGGAIETQDPDPVAAALRETEEETGMDTSDVEILGFLDTYLTITRYAITPVVARIPPGKALQPDPREVAELFEVPLEFVLDPGNVRSHVGRRGALRVRYFSIAYRDRNIWGATAGMLINLASKIKSV